MEVISDPCALQGYIEREQIWEHFDSRPQGFQLLRYQKGELLTAPFWPLGHFLFIIRGGIKIYGLREDGSSFFISRGVHGALLGDMEFVRKECPSFYTEALEEVLCIALPIEENREILQRDSRFLRYLLSCMSEKVFLFSMIGRSAQPVEDKLLTFLRELQPDHMLHGIDASLLQLHCSRRQLQRVVKKLCEQGKLKKAGKGKYRLMEEEKE